MKNVSAMLVFAAFLASPSFAQDIDGSQDHALLGRFEGSHIVAYEALEYSDNAMLGGKSEGERFPFDLTHEGAVTRIQYTAPAGTSALQILRGFEQKLTAEGFETRFSCTNKDNNQTDWCGSANSPAGVWTGIRGYDYSTNELSAFYAARENEDGATYIQISAAQSRHEVVFASAVVVENKEFVNKIIDAEAVTNELTAQGKMAFYDILFETGSAALKISSDDTLQIISSVIAASPDLKIIVVGHTDNEGALDFNIDLSRARAQAVQDRLVSNFGVAADRISAAGVAFLAPVTTNATNEGRALNRRVEIVVR
jgi:outer membrane protein OmpA-like peptidoglycan-associated protein